jgi:hypothetical protein
MRAGRRGTFGALVLAVALLGALTPQDRDLLDAARRGDVGPCAGRSGRAPT